MSEHTPGPWKLNDSNPFEHTDGKVSGSIFDITAEGGSFEDGLYWFKTIVPCVRTIGGETFYGFSSPEDARLIAAAPDLLEALKLAVARCQSCGGFKPEFWCDECAVAHAAIAKAEAR